MMGRQTEQRDLFSYSVDRTGGSTRRPGRPMSMPVPLQPVKPVHYGLNVRKQKGLLDPLNGTTIRKPLTPDEPRRTRRQASEIASAGNG